MDPFTGVVLLGIAAVGAVLALIGGACWLAGRILAHVGNLVLLPILKVTEVVGTAVHIHKDPAALAELQENVANDLKTQAKGVQEYWKGYAEKRKEQKAARKSNVVEAEIVSDPDEDIIG